LIGLTFCRGLAFPCAIGANLSDLPPWAIRETPRESTCFRDGTSLAERLTRQLVPMAIDKVIKRHFWAVILALIAVAACLDGQGSMRGVGAGLGAAPKQLTDVPLAARIPPAPRSASPHATAADHILSRNPFDSVTGPLNAVPAATGSTVLPPP